MSLDNVSRRRFMETSAAGASALAMGMSSAQKAWSANDKVVLGIIGTGGRGRQLLKTLDVVPGVQVAAVCDLIQERAEKAKAICQEYGSDPKIYLEFRDMLEKEKLDGCIVATEEYNHAKCAIPVLGSGIHCFSEKPVDVTIEKVEKVILAARQAKGFYQVGFQRRYAPNFQEGVRRLHSGEMGKITFLEGCWHFTWSLGGRALDMNKSGSWLLAQACHHLDVFSWVMRDRPPLRCAAMGFPTAQVDNPPLERSEDHSGVLFQFPDNVNCAYTHLMYCCEAFSDEKLWAHAEKGGIDLRQAMKYPRPNMGEPEKIEEPSPDYDFGTAYELRGFVDQIRENRKPLSNEDTAGISTLIGIMARKAMYDANRRVFEPKIVTWQDLGVDHLWKF